MNRVKDEFERLNKSYDEMLDRTGLAQRNASDSTGVLPQVVNGNTAYLKVVQDVHGNYAKLKKELLEIAKIPNAYVLFLGDVSTNGNLENEEHGNVYGNLRSPEEEIQKLISTLESEGIDIQKMMIGYLDGNHELRIKKKTSLRAGRIITDKLGCPEKYIQNAAKVVFELDNPLKQGEKIKISGLVRHGENVPANAGACVEKTTQKSLISGVNFVLSGHTHIMSYGNSVISYLDAKGNRKEKTVISANFGSDQNNAEYADRAGYQMTGRPDGEIMRISLVVNEDKTDFKPCIDMVNTRDILNQTALDSYEKALRVIEELEENKFKTEADLKQAYQEASKKISKYATNQSRRSAFRENPNIVFFAPWCGFKIGDESVKNEEEIDEAIKLVKNLPYCKIVLNGDMVKYRLPDTFAQKKHAKYPEDSFAYLELLAEKLKPVKDKIIAYNSGVEETKIMTYHGEELAKFAMNRLQMDESLVYKPYNKLKYKAEQLKVQSKQVEEYNKKVLKDECNKFAMNPHKMEEYDKYIKENFHNKKHDSDEVFKKYVANILREQGKLISVENKQKINKMFPLSEIDLRQPNDNLVQNILFTMLGINPKKIAINPIYNTQTENIVRLYTEEGKSEPIHLSGCYSTSVASRSAQENNMSRTQSHNLGYDVYYVNSKLGGEYLTKTASAYDIDGETVIKDVYHISGGRFDGARKYVNNTTSTNRIYTFKRVRKNEFVKYNETNGRTIYKSEGDFTIVANSIDYHSALFNQDIRINMLLSMLKNSFNKKYEEYMQSKKKKVLDIESDFKKNAENWQAKHNLLEKVKLKYTKQDKKQTQENTQEQENVM